MTSGQANNTIVANLFRAIVDEKMKELYGCDIPINFEFTIEIAPTRADMTFGIKVEDGGVKKRVKGAYISEDGAIGAIYEIEFEDGKVRRIIKSLPLPQNFKNRPDMQKVFADTYTHERTGHDGFALYLYRAFPTLFYIYASDPKTAEQVGIRERLIKFGEAYAYAIGSVLLGEENLNAVEPYNVKQEYIDLKCGYSANGIKGMEEVLRDELERLEIVAKAAI